MFYKRKTLPAIVSLQCRESLRIILYVCFYYFFFLAGDPSQNINISDVLLWAIFANRKELAEICWLKGHDHLSKYGNAFTLNIAQL